MDNFHSADCCTVCLGIKHSLIETISLDYDSIKFSDKLMACVAEVMWLKEGLPSLICSDCIERLRVAYDFRNLCLQSDQTFTRYISQLRDENKLVESPVENMNLLEVETKLECTSTKVVMEILPHIEEKFPNSPQIHFIDDDDCLENTECFMETGKSRNCLPALEKCNSVINQKHLEPVIDDIDKQHNIEKIESEQATQTIQLDQQQPLIHLQSELQVQHELQVQQQPSQQKHGIKGTNGVQERPRSLEHVTLDGAQYKRYTCRVCSKTYQSSNGLNVHMRTHNRSEKPFECEYCKKRFYYSDNLTQHIKLHKGEKPFQCEVCNKRFSKHEIAVHMKGHAGEKPFTCTVCGHGCLTSTDLKVHMRTHAGEKPYRCDFCGKKFTTSFNLKCHIGIHTGIRPYTRKICEKTFSFSSSFSAHVGRHTAKKFLEENLTKKKPS